MSDTVTGEDLRQFIERCERLDEEKKAISADIKEVKAEAKGRGYDVRIINMILRLRRMDTNERMEQDALLDLYMSHLGMLPPDGDA
jgi:uncharacterized protein (UPF0335 family)